MQRRKVLFASVGFLGAIACGDRSTKSVELTQVSDESRKPIVVSASRSIDPARYLALLPAPKFKSGHTLPLLSRFGWILPFEARVELADRWGYALEWGSASSASVEQALSNPQSVEAKTLMLAASQPKRYKLVVTLDRGLPNTPESIWLRNDRGELLDGKQTWGPEAPIAAFRQPQSYEPIHYSRFGKKPRSE